LLSIVLLLLLSRLSQRLTLHWSWPYDHPSMRVRQRTISWISLQNLRKPIGRPTLAKFGTEVVPFSGTEWRLG